MDHVRARFDAPPDLKHAPPVRSAVLTASMIAPPEGSAGIRGSSAARWSSTDRRWDFTTTGAHRFRERAPGIQRRAASIETRSHNCRLGRVSIDTQPVMSAQQRPKRAPQRFKSANQPAIWSNEPPRRAPFRPNDHICALIRRNQPVISANHQEIMDNEQERSATVREISAIQRESSAIPGVICDDDQDIRSNDREIRSIEQENSAAQQDNCTVGLEMSAAQQERSATLPDSSDDGLNIGAVQQETSAVLPVVCATHADSMHNRLERCAVLRLMSAGRVPRSWNPARRCRPKRDRSGTRRCTADSGRFRPIRRSGDVSQGGRRLGASHHSQSNRATDERAASAATRQRWDSEDLIPPCVGEPILLAGHEVERVLIVSTERNLRNLTQRVLRW